MKKATIKDIAKKLGIAHSTVSMVLNNKGPISEKTKKKVLKMAEKMGYEPNLFARALKSGKTNKIAVVIQNFNSVFAANALNAIENKIRIYGFDLSVYSIDANENILTKILNEKLADGVIVITIPVPPDLIKEYDKKNIPLVLIEETANNFANFAVILNNTKAGYSATEHLIKKGAKKIALLSGPIEREYAFQRYNGFLFALKNFNSKYYPNLTYQFKNHSFKDGINAFHYLKNKKFDAVFSSGGDMVAAGFISEAMKFNLKPKRDFLIIGFDDINIAEAIGLTTVRQPFYEMGLKSLDLLIDALKNNTKNKIITFEGELVIRNTT